MQANSATATVVMATTESSDEEPIVVVTPNGDYHIRKIEYVVPVEETSQSASAEFVLNK